MRRYGMNGLSGSISEHRGVAAEKLNLVEIVITQGYAPSPRQVTGCIFNLGQVAAHLDEIPAGRAKMSLASRYKHARTRVMSWTPRIGCGSR